MKIVADFVLFCCPIKTFIMFVSTRGKDSSPVFVSAPLLFLPQVRDVWYEAGTVWYVHKDGFTLGELLKQPCTYFMLQLDLFTY